MATLNVNDRVLAVLGDEHNLVVCTRTQTVTKLSRVAVAPAPNAPHTPYLGLVRHCAALSPDGRWYAVAAGHSVAVWSTDDWRLKSAKTLRRCASRIVFTPSGDRMLVADKSGDVYAYAVDDDDDDGGGGVPLLGHLSILLDVAVTPDARYVVTCDRDEKIRVSRYPNAHHIERYCLGHVAFVTRVLLLEDETLLSGSGDGCLKFWRYASGECVSTCRVRRPEQQPEAEADRCIVANVSACERGDALVVCVSVFRYDGLLVYACDDKRATRYRLTFAHKIDCCEPLDFVARDSVLWILKYSASCALKAFAWDWRARRYVDAVPSAVNETVAVVNRHCASVADSRVDLSVLCKKFDLIAKPGAKKIKLT